MSESLESKEILGVLPHRYPFLFIDRVIESDHKTKITCIKNLTYNEPFFQGHFPGRPVMPGVLQIETIAQCSGILLNQVSGLEGRIAFLTSVDKARFRRMCVPGDTLIVTAELVKVKSFLCKVEGTITVDGEKAASAEITFAFGRDESDDT